MPPLTGPTLLPMHRDSVLGLRGKLRRLRAMQPSIQSDPLRQMPLMVDACPRSKAPSQKRCGGSAGTTGGCGFPRPDSARNGDMLCHVARGVAAIAARDACSLLGVASSSSSSSPLPLLVARTRTCPVLTSSTGAARRFQRRAPVSVDRGAAGGPRFPGASAGPAPTIVARWAVHGETGAVALHPLYCRSRSVGGAGGSEAPAGGGSLRPLGCATEERSIFFYLHAHVFLCGGREGNGPLREWFVRRGSRQHVPERSKSKHMGRSSSKGYRTAATAAESAAVTTIATATMSATARPKVFLIKKSSSSCV